MSTTGTVPFQCVQRLHSTRGKRIQIAEPRRCAAFDSNGCPSSHGANSFSQYAMPSCWLIASSPAAFHVSSGVSTMKVEVSSSKR